MTNNLFEVDFCLALLKKLMLIREAEESIGRESEKGSFKTPVHLGIGQEAIAVGISSNLNENDLVFGNHRSHAHYISLGGSLDALFAEILGKREGCSGGHGGSMHITAPNVGFMGSMPIVAGTIPIAVGAALQLEKNSTQITVSFFGDGATEEGVFHETLNFAALHSAPTLFVCENNLFSSHMHISERQSNKKLTSFAENYGIASRQSNGNDLTEFFEIANDCVDYVRKRRKPLFLEAFTYRTVGHVGFQEDSNIGIERERDLGEWKAKDPIKLFEQSLEARFGSLNAIPTIREEVRLEVEKAWARAFAMNLPTEDDLLRDVLFESKS